MIDEDGTSVSEQRMRYLRSFPKYFNQFKEDHKDAVGKYAILQNISTTDNSNWAKSMKHDGMEYVNYEKVGKTDAMMKDLITESWSQMSMDDNEDVRNMAFALARYAMLRDGLRFGDGFGWLIPLDITQQFYEYNEALRNIDEDMSDEEISVFLDQFIRNNLRGLNKYLTKRLTAREIGVLKGDRLKLLKEEEFSYVKDEKKGHTYSENEIHKSKYLVPATDRIVVGISKGKEKSILERMTWKNGKPVQYFFIDQYRSQDFAYIDFKYKKPIVYRLESFDRASGQYTYVLTIRTWLMFLMTIMTSPLRLPLTGLTFTSILVT